MAGASDPEIAVAVEVVGQEAHAILERHERSGQQQTAGELARNPAGQRDGPAPQPAALDLEREPFAAHVRAERLQCADLFGEGSGPELGSTVEAARPRSPSRNWAWSDTGRARSIATSPVRIRSAAY